MHTPHLKTSPWDSYIQYLTNVSTHFNPRVLHINSCVEVFWGDSSVHWQLHIELCYIFSFAPWKVITKYIQKCEGCTQFCDTVCLLVFFKEINLATLPGMALIMFMSQENTINNNFCGLFVCKQCLNSMNFSRCYIILHAAVSHNH